MLVLYNSFIPIKTEDAGNIGRLYGRQIPYDCTPFGCNETRMHAILCEKKDRVYFVPDTLTRQKKKDLCNVAIVLGVQLIMKGHF
ncbi:hypothetical protein [Nitrosopumilus sp.]|uniref:hypothetical protein n=1 Tax=Nitrosopumilus sp. TaxID=2024843 RepID=UPI003B5C3471